MTKADLLAARRQTADAIWLLLPPKETRIDCKVPYCSTILSIDSKGDVEIKDDRCRLNPKNYIDMPFDSLIALRDCLLRKVKDKKWQPTNEPVQSG